MSNHVKCGRGAHVLLGARNNSHCNRHFHNYHVENIDDEHTERAIAGGPWACEKWLGPGLIGCGQPDQAYTVQD